MYEGLDKGWGIVLFIFAVICGIVGWGVIETVIWIFSHIHWS